MEEQALGALLHTQLSCSLGATPFLLQAALAIWGANLTTFQPVLQTHHWVLLTTSVEVGYTGGSDAASGKSSELCIPQACASLLTSEHLFLDELHISKVLPA